MRFELVSTVALLAWASASPAVLSQDGPDVRADALAFTGDTVHTHQGHRQLAKRADFRGDCGIEQWDIVHDAMYACRYVARRAAEVARANRARLKEFFPPTAETGNGREYVRKVVNVVVDVFKKIERECGHENLPAFPMLQVNCEKKPGQMCSSENENTFASTTPDLRHGDEAHSPYGIVWICPQFFHPELPLIDEYAALQDDGADRAMVFIHQMTQIKAIRGTRDITPPGDPDALIGMNGNDALWNSASYTYFARAVRYPEQYWHPFPG